MKRVIAYFTRLSIRHQITWVALFTSLVVLVVTWLAFVTGDVAATRKAMVQSMSGLANVVGVNSTAALAFRDPQTGAEILKALSTRPEVFSAILYDGENSPFAIYKSDLERHRSFHELVAAERDPADPTKELPARASHSFAKKYLVVHQPVQLNDKRIGHLSIYADLGRLARELTRKLIVAGVVLLGAIVGAYMIATRLQRMISDPILDMAGKMNLVSGHSDYSIRVDKTREGELGILMSGFNEMLDRIESRETELNRVLQQLVVAKEEAEAASQTKSQFLAAMSHEIRTPMNGVLGMTELLLGSRLSKDQQHYANTIGRSGQALLSIINDILDFSKFEAGKFELERARFDILTLVEDCVEMLAEPAQRKKLELLCDLPFGPNPLPLGDKTRLRQVLINLIGNAIKFTECGEIKVSVRVLQETAERLRYRVSVRDTGIGIDAGKKELIFESFTQADNSTTRKFGGTGLGLAISRNIIELMGGELKVDSEPGEGSEFWFEIELDNSGERSADATTDLNGLHVLIVDDNGSSRELLRSRLAAWGADTQCAADSRSGLSALNRAVADGEPFDLAVLDLRMPDMDGIDLAREIEGDAAIADTKRILLNPMGETKLQAIENEGLFSGTLSKPVRSSQLHACIVHALNRKAPGANDPETSRAPVQPLIRSSAAILLVEDNPVNQDVATEMLKRLGCRTSIAANGIEGVSAVKQHSFDLVFMDCEMPMMDGFEATQTIRRMECGCDGHLPIVALTANAIEGDREVCIAKGMDDYLTKPFSIAQLAEMIEEWAPHTVTGPSLEDPDSQPDGGQVIEAHSTSESDTRSLTQLEPAVIAGLKAIAVGPEEAFLSRILNNFLVSSTETLDRLRRSIDHLDLEAGRQFAHSLKSSSANIGAMKLSEYCRLLEQDARAGRGSGLDNRLANIVEEHAEVQAVLRRDYARYIELGEQPAGEIAPAEIAENGHVVLVVDDDSNMRLMAGNALQQSGFRVLHAEDGYKAIEVFKREQPDLVLMDVEMPTMGGFMACTLIRELDGGSTVPILMVTGLDDLESIQNAYKAGATDFVTKPLNWTVIIHRLHYMLRANKTLTALKQSETRLENAQHLAAIGDWKLDYEDQSLQISDEVYRLFGMSPSSKITDIRRFFDLVAPDEQPFVRTAFDGARTADGSFNLEFQVNLPGGGQRVLAAQGAVEKDADGTAASMVGTFQDITIRKQAEERISTLAYFDVLTGLPNRQFFKDRLVQALEVASRHQKELAVLFIDLDNFKQVNDTLGHTAGDEVLSEVSERLKACVRSSDWVDTSQILPNEKDFARLGGDEFVLLLSEIRSAEDVSIVASRIIENIASPIALENTEVIITPSIGIATYPTDGSDVETLIRNADTAMYHAKAEGRNNFQFFSAALNKRANRRMELENALRKAIEREEFYLNYQPQVSLRDHSIVAVEALARWKSHELGEVSPGHFIPIAEECGMILELGDWVLNEVCRQIKRWQFAGYPDMKVAVNISSLQFRNQNLTRNLLDITSAHDVATSSIELELTESVLMSGINEAVETLGSLKEAGFTISLDDFGTGYSSLSYLKLFPIDLLKIDRSFVSDIPGDENDVAIVEAIVAMAHKLNMRVVAEGVETELQREFLTAQGCDIVQGYLISAPVPAEQVQAFFAQPRLLQQS